MGSLVYCSPWGCRVGHDWETEQHTTFYHVYGGDWQLPNTSNISPSFSVREHWLFSDYWGEKKDYIFQTPLSTGIANIRSGHVWKQNFCDTSKKDAEIDLMQLQQVFCAFLLFFSSQHTWVWSVEIQQLFWTVKTEAIKLGWWRENRTSQGSLWLETTK